MSEENSDEMTVGEDMYVNEATLELLRRRVESDVKRGFFRSVGLPVGGAGIVAILFFLFVWGPRAVQDYVREDPAFEETLLKTTEDYLEDPQAGQAEIRRHVGATTRNYLTEPGGQRMIQDIVRQAAIETVRHEVAAYFESGEGETFLQKQLASETEDYFRTNEGREQLLLTVEDGLLSEKVQTALTRTVKSDVEQSIRNDIPREVNSYLQSDKVQNVLQENVVAAAMKHFRTNPGKKELSKALQKQLDSEEMKKVIEKAVRDRGRGIPVRPRPQ